MLPLLRAAPRLRCVSSVNFDAALTERVDAWLHERGAARAEAAAASTE